MTPRGLYTSLFNKKYKPNTIQGIHNVLHKALENAVLWKLISSNVADQVTIPHRKGGEEETEVGHALTAKQALHLLKVSRGDPREAFIALALITAMRHGELAALRWQDIDLVEMKLSVKWTVAHDWQYGFIKSDPKSKKSARNIQLPRYVVNALLRHREWQLAHAQQMGERWEKNDLVFPNRYGRYAQRGYRGIKFRQLLERAGLPQIRIHDLRHSAATLLIVVLKMPPKLVQGLLGHATIDMTMDIYTHADETHQREMMDAFDRFIDDNFE